MADQIPNPTTWSDDQLDSLLDALAERAAERDDLDLPGGGASRRGVLAGLLGLGSAAAGGVGLASAIGESESYGSSTGVVGSDTQPLSEANVKNLHVQDLQVDRDFQIQNLEPNSVTAGTVINKYNATKGREAVGLAHNSGSTDGSTPLSLDLSGASDTFSAYEVHFDYFADGTAGTTRLTFRINQDNSSSYTFRDLFSGTEVTGADEVELNSTEASRNEEHRFGMIRIHGDTFIAMIEGRAAKSGAFIKTGSLPFRDGFSSFDFLERDEGDGGSYFVDAGIIGVNQVIDL